MIPSDLILETLTRISVDIESPSELFLALSLTKFKSNLSDASNPHQNLYPYPTKSLTNSLTKTLNLSSSF
jgi:hypothetical protein